MIGEMKYGVFLEGTELAQMLDEDEKLALDVEDAEVIELSTAPTCLREALEMEQDHGK